MDSTSLAKKIKKLYYTFRLHGFGRAYIKVFGRTRSTLLPRLPLTIVPRKRIVGIIGCGQFSTSTIGFFVKKNRGNIIAGCYDLDESNSSSFSRYFGGRICKSVDELLSLKNLRIVYIASNHSTHTDYAIQALERGLMVHVEKPISTSFDQYNRLRKTIVAHPGKIVVGYNRPYARATSMLIARLKNRVGPLTLNCFVTGHKIPPGHWYRLPAEGTRICGNLGHWIDLAVHLLCAKGNMAMSWKIRITYSSDTESDDNFTVTLTSDPGDLIILTLSSRADPFEGINETINCQCEDVICKIDDFRAITIWEGDRYTARKFFRKDVGHERSVLQVFSKHVRDWSEVEISTRLMLTIAEMVVNRAEQGNFRLQA